jgi:hypothetical protein
MLNLQVTKKDNMLLASKKEMFLPILEPQNKRSIYIIKSSVFNNKSMWINEKLEVQMDAIEKKTYSFKTTINSLNILMNFLSNHMNGKTRCRKIEPRGLLTKKKDAIMITSLLQNVVVVH